MNQINSKTLVLLSGGIDSVTLLHAVVTESETVVAVSFDYGSKHNASELPMAAWQCGQLGIEHTVIPLSFMADHFRSALLKAGGDIPEGHYQEASMKQTVVPFRNGIMLAVAAGFAESIQASGLAIAAHAGDHAIYPDCRDTFMRPMGEAITAGTYAGITLERPFIHKSKAEIVAIGAGLGVDYSQTWSCYKGGEWHCGKCGTCVERREAFIRAGVADPTSYESTPPLPAGPGDEQ